MRSLFSLASATGVVAVAVLATTSISHRPPASSGAEPAPVARVVVPASADATAPATGDAVAATPPAAPDAVPAPRAGAARMILAVDPETGQLGLPVPALDRALSIEEMQSLARAEAEGLVTLRHADGSETLNHEGRFADHSIARIGPDGKPVFHCVHGEGQLEHAMHVPPSAQPAAEEK